MRITSLRTSTLLLTCVAALSGCVFQDIRDELVTANYQLETRLAALEVTNERLGDIKSELGKTNELLAETDERLATSTEKLASVERRLDVLQPILKALESIDSSLQVVKQMIEKIPLLRPPEP